VATIPGGYTRWKYLTGRRASVRLLDGRAIGSSSASDIAHGRYPANAASRSSPMTPALPQGYDTFRTVHSGRENQQGCPHKCCEAYRMGRIGCSWVRRRPDPVRRACWAGSLTNGNESRRAKRTEATLSPTCAALLLLSSRDNNSKATHVAPDVRQRGGQVPAAPSRHDRRIHTVTSAGVDHRNCGQCPRPAGKAPAGAGVPVVRSWIPGVAGGTTESKIGASHAQEFGSAVSAPTPPSLVPASLTTDPNADREGVQSMRTVRATRSR
jgi:hypothetical protein